MTGDLLLTSLFYKVLAHITFYLPAFFEIWFDVAAVDSLRTLFIKKPSLFSMIHTPDDYNNIY